MSSFKIYPVILISTLISFFYTTIFAQTKTNQLDTNMLKQGSWKKAYPNGKTRYEGQFKNDKPIGLFKYYYESGELKSIANFSDNGKKSFVTTFYQNGKKWSEGNYIDEKKDSVWKYYDKLGNIQTEEIFTKGIKNGASSIYYENGKLSSAFFYKNDKKDGACTEYLSSGKIKTKSTYKEGELWGDYEVNYPNEKPYKKGKYEKSLPVGWWGTYNPEGELQVREFFVKGISKKMEYLNGKFEDYYDSQIPKEITTYKKGKKNGPFTEFYDLGIFKKSERVNEETGEKETYEYLEGQVSKRKGNYIDDKLDGEIIYFDIKGKISKKEIYKNGEKQK